MLKWFVSANKSDKHNKIKRSWAQLLLIGFNLLVLQYNTISRHYNKNIIKLITLQTTIESCIWYDS